MLDAPGSAMRRSIFSSRYYESHIELDNIYFIAKDRIPVSELKTDQERKALLRETQKKFENSTIGKKWTIENVDIRAMDRFCPVRLDSRHSL